MTVGGSAKFSHSSRFFAFLVDRFYALFGLLPIYICPVGGTEEIWGTKYSPDTQKQEEESKSTKQRELRYGDKRTKEWGKERERKESRLRFIGDYFTPRELFIYCKGAAISRRCTIESSGRLRRYINGPWYQKKESNSHDIIIIGFDLAEQ